MHQNLYRKAAKKEGKPHGTFAHRLQSLNPAEAEQEMNIAFQKSNYLKHVSVNLSTSIGLINHSTLIDENRDSPPLRDITLDAFSQENKNLVVHAVHLHRNGSLPHRKENFNHLSGNMDMSNTLLAYWLKKNRKCLQVTPRLVWDYRKLNKVTKPDVYPLPRSK